MFFIKLNNKNNKIYEFEISQPEPNDLLEILDLQDNIMNSINDINWYSKLTKKEIEEAINNKKDYLCLKISHNEKIVAFAFIILNPDKKYDLYLDLENNGIVVNYKNNERCVFETSFVDKNYRGFGLQSLLINILSNWGRLVGKKAVFATVHPDNIYSEKNFENNTYFKVTAKPLDKYGGKRHYFVKILN